MINGARKSGGEKEVEQILQWNSGEMRKWAGWVGIKCVKLTGCDYCRICCKACSNREIMQGKLQAPLSPLPSWGLGRNTVLLDAVDQGRSRNTEQFGGIGLVAVAEFQGLDNEILG